MSFKTFIYLFLLLFFSGCGVKAQPLKPPETTIKSYVESYTDVPDKGPELKPQTKKK